MLHSFDNSLNPDEKFSICESDISSLEKKDLICGDFNFISPFCDSLKENTNDFLGRKREGIDYLDDEQILKEVNINFSSERYDEIKEKEENQIFNMVNLKKDGDIMIDKINYEKNINNENSGEGYLIDIPNDDKKKEVEKGNNQIKNKFSVKKMKKPGRKGEDNKGENCFKKIHGSKEYDNIVTKVKVHFISFLINLSNDIIIHIFGNDKNLYFKDLDYKIKSNVKFIELEKFKQLNLKEILQKPISKKFMPQNANNNEETYKKVIELANYLEKFFNLKFIVLFKSYYNNNYISLIKYVIDTTIIPSKKTESFSELLKKYNDEMKILIIKYTRRAYFGEIEENETNSKKAFKIKRYN